MQTSSPILFIVFNRPDVTAKVFEAIRRARPAKLYVAGDGPRATRSGEDQLCARARAVAANVDWPCEVHTKFGEKNLGCKEGVVSALDWFFASEQEGIILEDDCLPAPDFFRFCDEMLGYYRDDARVRHIGGSNLQGGIKRGEGTYYFSRLTHIWGWASWRRVWREYDKDLAQVSLTHIEKEATEYFDDPAIAMHWKRLATALKSNKIDTWDYQLSIANFLSKGVSVIPNVNLISNLGFGVNATHTHNGNDVNANLDTGHLSGEITHPQNVTPSQEGDMHTLNADPSIISARKKYSRLRNRVKRWIARHGGPQSWV